MGKNDYIGIPQAIPTQNREMIGTVVTFICAWFSFLHRD